MKQYEQEYANFVPIGMEYKYSIQPPLAAGVSTVDIELG
jgi:hypothetical protein